MNNKSWQVFEFIMFFLLKYLFWPLPIGYNLWLPVLLHNKALVSPCDFCIKALLFLEKTVVWLNCHQKKKTNLQILKRWDCFALLLSAQFSSGLDAGSKDSREGQPINNLTCDQLQWDPTWRVGCNRKRALKNQIPQSLNSCLSSGPSNHTAGVRLQTVIRDSRSWSGEIQDWWHDTDGFLLHHLVCICNP